MRFVDASARNKPAPPTVIALICHEGFSVLWPIAAAQHQLVAGDAGSRLPLPVKKRQGVSEERSGRSVQGGWEG